MADLLDLLHWEASPDHLGRPGMDLCGEAAAEIKRLRTELGATPCKRLMLQEQPYDECFPFHNCEGCDCWRSRVGNRQ